jgi:hypothetical protein
MSHPDSSDISIVVAIVRYAFILFCTSETGQAALCRSSAACRCTLPECMYIGHRPSIQHCTTAIALAQRMQALPSAQRTCDCMTVRERCSCGPSWHHQLPAQIHHRGAAARRNAGVLALWPRPAGRAKRVADVPHEACVHAVSAKVCGTVTLAA